MTAPTDSEQLTVSRLINAQPDRIFEAWTTPELIVRWWGAGPVHCPEADVDLTIGGKYRIANEMPDGSRTWITGRFELIERPARLVYTWATEPIDDTAEFSLVDVTFDSTDEGTLVTVRHTRIRGVEAKEMNEMGWAGCLDGLRALMSPTGTLL